MHREEMVNDGGGSGCDVEGLVVAVAAACCAQTLLQVGSDSGSGLSMAKR
jgi:hypothetical protein